MRTLTACPFCVLLFACLLSGQTPPAQPSNPQALAQLTQAVAAFWGATTPRAVELDGAVISHVPPGQSGNAILKVEPSGRSTFETDLGSEKHVQTTSVRDDHSGCQADSNGGLHARAIHNCFLVANPLLPLVTLSSHVSDTTIALPEKGTASAVQVSLPLTDADPGSLPLLRHLSTILIAFDPQSHLPTTADYSEHPEKNAKADIPVQVRYSEYKNVSGVMIPHSIQKYINGGLVLDLRIESVKFY